ncbi:hypothetical protein BKY29_07540 [Weissella confusa]|uniref:hypothetical protein n=1 Tax=Weissella confusa TaxID=1583 RepID=UPI0008FE32A2|nr:hypothetical protein [Weissella confusa]OJF03092.1 hypothetical protein BKY29_07540 [Weissella confusa]
MNKPKLFLDMDNVLVDTLLILNAIDMAGETVAKPDQIPGIALMLDLRTDFSLPCKLIAEEHFLYDSIFTRI